MTSKIEQYAEKIKNAKIELESMPNSTRTKAQYANLIDKIKERNDLENIEVTIHDVKTNVLEVLEIAVKSIETPKEVKERRKQLNKIVRTYENKILVELGVKTIQDDNEEDTE